MENSSESGPKLSEIFDHLVEVEEFLDTTDKPTPSNDVQEKVKQGVEEGEAAIHMVNQLSLFSDNEEISEVTTKSLRYMLLPAFLGHICGKNTQEDRFEVVKKSQGYYMDYLRLVKSYGVTNIQLPKISDDTESGNDEQRTAPPNRGTLTDIQRMNTTRQNKIERFKQQKENEAKLKELKQRISGSNVDDEDEREYYSTLFKKWINIALEEIEGIQSELPILGHMAKMKAHGQNGSAAQPAAEQKTQKPKQPMRPFILTRDKVQAAVIGAGYPSLPTYTVEQFYEMKYKEQQQQQPPASGVGGGSLQGMSQDQSEEARQKEAEEVAKEEAAERDDPDALKKARDWDDWKDDHRRGWGNRQNMG